MDIKRIIKRLIRGGEFLLTSWFIEKPKGLDFSMRQKENGIKEKGNHGYALTQRKAFANIMGMFNISNEDSFIDIGCGKGGVLRYAVEYPFCRVAGIEIEDSLYDIAKKNFNILKTDKIELFHDNAVLFNRYGEFNYFFFFIPFDGDIYEKVIDNIISSTKDSRRPVYLICYGDSIPEYIDATGEFSVYREYTDHVRETAVCVWKKIGQDTHS